MGHKHRPEDVLAGAVEVAFAEGLSRVTFGRVGKHLGTSDRVVVYYFPTKDALVGAVLAALGAELQGVLAPAFATPSDDHRALLRSAWPLLARPEVDPVFALFFEANGLAAAGLEPYRTVVPQLVDAWVAWAAEHLTGPPERRRAEAEAAIALVDGLLLLRHLAGPDAAERAMAVLAGDVEDGGPAPTSPPRPHRAARTRRSP